MTTTTTNAPSPAKASVAAVELKEFNNGFPSLNDPEEFLGTWQKQFSESFVYVVPRDKVEQVHDEILQSLINKLGSGSLGNCTFRRIDYLDRAYRSIEKPRNYILIEKETVRGTHLTVSLKVITMGDNLYVSIDSYSLGRIAFMPLLVRVLITLLVPLLLFIPVLLLLSRLGGQVAPIETRYSPDLAIPLIYSDPGILCLIVPLLLFFLLAWNRVIRAWSRHRNLILALRQAFLGPINTHSFDIDETIMFFKSALPLVTYSIHNVLEKYDLPIKNLEQFSQNIMNVTTISNGSGNISFIDSIFGNHNKNSRVE